MKSFFLGLWLRIVPAKPKQPTPQAVRFTAPETNDSGRLYTFTGWNLFTKRAVPYVANGLLLRELVTPKQPGAEN